MEFCGPTIFNLVLGTISIIAQIVIGSSTLSIMVDILFVILWTFLLNYLCSIGWSFLGWLLVLFPFVVLLLLYLLTVDISLMKRTASPSPTSNTFTIIPTKIPTQRITNAAAVAPTQSITLFPTTRSA